MNKKIILSTLFLAFCVSAGFAQMRVVNHSGIGGHYRGVIFDTNHISPIVFRVNGVLAGSTGAPGGSPPMRYSYHTSVSFGFGAFSSFRGSNNTAIGFQSLPGTNNNNSIVSGVQGNTAIGAHALSHSLSAHFNTAIGAFALRSNIIGRQNTAVGYRADVSASTFHNTTAIGYRALATASHQVRIGNSSVSSIGGQVGWSTFSDGRAKRSIRAEVPGLDFINRLNPVIYTLNLDVVDELMGIDRTQTFAFYSELGGERCFEQEQLHIEMLEQERIARENRQSQLQTGFIAQDVRAAAESIGYDFSGIVVDELGIYGLRYSEFVVPLVRAVQELSQLNNQMQAEIEELRSELRQLQGGIIGIPTPPPIQVMNTPAPNDAWNSIDGTRTAALYQNIPNPFRQGTEIRFYLPQTVTTAFLIFYDLQGRQLHQITLTQRGEGVEFIQGSQFAPGIYLYALIADGQVAAVKQMIITK